MRPFLRLTSLLLRLLMAVALLLGPMMAGHQTAVAGPTASMHGVSGQVGAMHAAQAAVAPRPAHGHHDRASASPQAHAHSGASVASVAPGVTGDNGGCDGHRHNGGPGAPGCCGAGSCWIACHPALPAVAPLLAMPAGASVRALRETPDPVGPALEVAEPPPRAMA